MTDPEVVPDVGGLRGDDSRQKKHVEDLDLVRSSPSSVVMVMLYVLQLNVLFLSRNTRWS